jgi:hypothetical protein
LGGVHGLALFGTGGLEAQKLVMGSEEGALGTGFIAGQDGEGARAAGVAEKDVGEAVAGCEVVHVVGVFGQAEFEQAGFQAADAGEAPGGHDDLLDQKDLDGADGPVVLLVGFGEFLELAIVFEGDDGVLGGEPMFEGIQANGGLAFGGLGAGGFEGIGTVGVDLFLGSHGGAPWGNWRGRVAPS